MEYIETNNNSAETKREKGRKRERKLIRTENLANKLEGINEFFLPA